MGTWKQAGRSRMGAAGILIAVLVGVAVFAIGPTVQDRALAQQEDLEGAMVLGANGPDVSCSSGSCDVPPGGEFTLTVSTAGIPEGGYIGIQTQVVYSGIVYTPTEGGPDDFYTGEGEDVWPDNDGQGGLSLRAPSQLRRGWVSHGGVSAFVPPFDDPSTYEGVLIQLAAACHDEEGSSTVYLLAYDAAVNPGGSSYSGVEADAMAQITVPIASSGEVDLDLAGAQSEGPYAVGSSLEINCVVAEEDDVDDDVDDATEEPEPTSTPPPDLPTTGSAPNAGGAAGAGAWTIMLVLFIAGAGLLTVGWRNARGRQTS